MIRPRLRLSSALAAFVTVLAACEYPTEAPIIEQRWIIPAEEISVSVAELLPAGVQVVGSDFQVDVPSFMVSESLGDSCPICIDSGGFVVPVPPFSTSFSVGENLPNDVGSVQLTSASIDFTIDNQLGFDPVEGGGIVTLTLTDGPGGAFLGEVSWDGSMGESLGAGMNMESLVMTPGPITNFAIDVDITSAGGQMAAIDPSAQFTVTAVPSPILVSSVTVAVPAQTVNFDPTEVDLEGIDSDLAKNILEGAVNLEIQNPFGVTIDAVLEINYSGGPPIQKILNVPADPISTTTLSYTGEELQSFIGQPDVTFSGMGTANAASVTVTPTQVLVMQAELDVTLEVGR